MAEKYDSARRALCGKRLPPQLSAMLTFDLLFTDTPPRVLAKKYGISISAAYSRRAALFKSKSAARAAKKAALIRTDKNGTPFDWTGEAAAKKYTL